MKDFKSYKFLPTATCQFDDNVSIHQGQTESEDHSVIIIKKTEARELALSICPELAHLEGALLAEQELNNQLKGEIERLNQDIKHHLRSAFALSQMNSDFNLEDYITKHTKP